MLKLIFSLFFLLLMPLCVHAASDVIATYKYSDGNMVTLCTRDSRHVRMDTSPSSYLLLQGDKVYAVSRDDGGNWQVMDMDSMNGAGGFSSMFGGGATPAKDVVRYEKTGKTEKIAGYVGTVYNAVVYQDGKVVSRDEIVLSNHANLKRLTDAWMAMASSMSNMNAAFDASMEEAGKMGYGGMLRYGNSMRLSNLQIKDLNASYYELPSGVQEVQMPSQPSQQSDGGLNDDAKDIGLDAKEATKDEIKSGVRSAISNIFN